MRLYRISSEKYAQSLGASGRANRWNVSKQYVIYASSSRSLAALELLAHRNAIMEGLKYKMVVIEFPGQKGTVEIMDEKKLLPNWHLLQYRANTQKLGGVWYEQKSSVALKVPSAIIPYEFNFVLNTQHPGFSQVKIERLEDFNWDQRLL